jgi:hypothetical protein
LKVQWQFWERVCWITAANTWEELTFDFTNVSTTNTASDMVFIFDLGTAGDGSANSTYLLTR